MPRDPEPSARPELQQNEFAPLISAALQVRANAHAPYSEYRVGAAIWSRGRRRLWTGCNVENASYALTVCAERVAVATAIAAGEREFEVLAVATSDGAFPCGACRQVLMEFAPDLTIVIVNAMHHSHQTRSLRELLPDAFRRHDRT